MNRLSTPNKNTHTGSTLIEVLIALLVFSIGLQGIASLQYQAVKENFDSSQRSHAVWMAQELINRIKANPDGREAGSYNAAPDCDNLDKCGECNGTDMAAFDLAEMFCTSQEVLLNPPDDEPLLEVTCNDADATDGLTCSPNSDFTLTLQWSSKVVKDDTQNITDDADSTLTIQKFEQVFRP
ncbi:MAG: type IV pilus modification protein PilV [Porticoccaceae bacterium]